jgi:hypothetical protein
MIAAAERSAAAFFFARDREGIGMRDKGPSPLFPLPFFVDTNARPLDDLTGGETPMKFNCGLIWTGAVPLIATAHADAAYLGLGGKLHTSVNISGTVRNVFRIYAVFDNPDDYLLGAAGSEILGPMIIRSTNNLHTGLGSNFLNPTGGGSTAPSADVIGKLPNAQWDSFATVGTAINDGLDGTGLSPGFDQQFGGEFITGNSVTAPNAAWFTKGFQEQGRAGGFNGVSGTFMNGFQQLTGMGVMLAQLTVNAGSGVEGTLAVIVDLNGGVAGGTNVPNQTFFVIPAPGALPLLTVAGLVGSRRRRA